MAQYGPAAVRAGVRSSGLYHAGTASAERGSGERGEVRLVDLAVRGGRAAVVGDESDGPAGRSPRGPHPREIALLPRVQEVHDRVEERGVAAVGPDLGRDHGELRGDRPYGVRVAREVVAVVEVVHVPDGREVVLRIAGLVGQPLRQRVAVLNTAEGDDVRRAGCADCVHDRLHAGRLEADAGAGAAVAPALPRRGGVRVVVRVRLAVG